MIDYHSARTWEILEGISNGLGPDDYPFKLTEEELEMYHEEKKYFDQIKAEMIEEGRDPSILHFVPANDE